MATFNSAWEITADTSVVPDDGRKTRLSEGGLIRGRNSYAAPIFRIDVTIKGSVAIKQAIESFYTTNVNDMNSITIDDSTFTAMFVSMPRVTGKDGDIRWIQFELLGYES